MWWWWAVGSGGATLWVWSEQYPKGAIILQAELSPELLPPAVSKEGGFPVAQLGSTHSYCCFAQSTGADLPPPQQGAAESCWHECLLGPLSSPHPFSITKRMGDK